MNAKKTEKAMRASLHCKYNAKAIAHFGEDFFVARDLCDVADMRERAACDAERAMESWSDFPDVAQRLQENAKRYRKEAAELEALARKLICK